MSNAQEPVRSTPLVRRGACQTCLGCGRLKGRGIYVRGIVIDCPKCGGTGRAPNAVRSTTEAAHE